MKYYAPKCGTYALYDELMLEDTIMIGGLRGSGKSVFENGLIYSIANAYTPDEAELYLIDPKRVDLADWRVLPHVKRYTGDVEEAFDIIDELIEIMDHRYKIMSGSYPTKKVWEGSDIYLIIDEITDLVTLTKKAFVAKMMPLILKSRAAKMHIICCSQSLARATMPALMVSNMTVKVGLHVDMDIESRQIIGTKGCESLPKYGKAIIRRPGNGLETVDVPMYSDEHYSAMQSYYMSQRLAFMHRGKGGK